MIKVRGYELFTAYGKGERHRMVTLYSQPLHNWLWAKVYDIYSNTMHRIPGIRYLLDNVVRNKDADGFGIPWCANQDIRSFFLHRKNRKEIYTAELDEKNYHRLAGREEQGSEERSDGGSIQEIRGSDPTTPAP